MIHFFNEDICKETFEEMKGIVEGKSAEDIWTIACTYAENYINTKKQHEFAKAVSGINVQEIIDAATKVVSEQYQNKGYTDASKSS